MSERTFRLIQGIYLLIALFLEIDVMIYAFMGVFAFEALTNWRIPGLVTRMRFGSDYAKTVDAATGRFSFEAERMLTFIVKDSDLRAPGAAFSQFN